MTLAAILIGLAAGQTEEIPLLDRVFQASGVEEAPAGERHIRVIRHEERGWRLAGALRLRVALGPVFFGEEYETDTPGTPESEINPVDDLGISPAGVRLSGDLTYQPLARLALRVGGSWAEWRGSERLRSDLLVGQVLFPGGARTSSILRLSDLYFHLDQDFGRWSRGYHGFRVGARYFQTELLVRSDEGARERNRIGGALPLLGYRGGFTPLKGLELSGEISLYPEFVIREDSEDGDETRFAFVEMRVALEYVAADWLDLGVGYSFLEVFLEKERDQERESAVITTHGVSFWGTFRF